MPLPLPRLRRLAYCLLPGALFRTLYSQGPRVGLRDTTWRPASDPARRSSYDRGNRTKQLEHYNYYTAQAEDGAPRTDVHRRGATMGWGSKIDGAAGVKPSRRRIRRPWLSCRTAATSADPGLTRRPGGEGALDANAERAGAAAVALCRQFEWLTEGMGRPDAIVASAEAQCCVAAMTRRARRFLRRRRGRGRLAAAGSPRPSVQLGRDDGCVHRGAGHEGVEGAMARRAEASGYDELGRQFY